MITKLFGKKISSTIYNIFWGTLSYETPSAYWRLNPNKKTITQWTKKPNMEYNIIVYTPNNATYSKHILRMWKQAKTIHAIRP